MASDIVSYRKDSNDMESSVDSKKACCVKRSETYYHTKQSEVSNVESKQNFSPMAQNDKILETTPTNHTNKTTNSSNCSVALEALSELEGRSYPNDNDYPSNSLNRSNCIDKGEFLQNLDSKTHKSLKQLTLFFCIGGGITLLELLGFYILYKIFGVNYILASLIMFVLASGIGVWLYRRFVFGETHLHSSLEIGLTYLINTIGIGLNTLILWLCVEFLGFEAIVAKILASLLVAFYGFYARKLVIYRKEPKFYFYTKSPAPAHKGVDSNFIKKECQ